jgi:hypothetical protein
LPSLSGSINANSCLRPSTVNPVTYINLNLILNQPPLLCDSRRSRCRAQLAEGAG